jgi:hypothetical protein
MEWKWHKFIFSNVFDIWTSCFTFWIFVACSILWQISLMKTYFHHYSHFCKKITQFFFKKKHLQWGKEKPRSLSSCFNPCSNGSFNFMIVMVQENIIFDVKFLEVLVGSLVYNVQLWGLGSSSCSLNLNWHPFDENNTRIKLWT